MNNNLHNTIINAFYPVYMIIYFVLMFGIHITSYVGIPMVLAITLIALGYWQKTSFKHANAGIKLLSIWIIYNLSTVVFYSFNGLPISCYIDGLRNYLFPVLFFFIGSYNLNSDDKFYDWFLIACAFFFIVGFYLYFFTPSYYVSFLVESKQNTWYLDSTYVDEGNVMQFTRFSSFMSTSYVASALSVSMMACSFGYLFRHKSIKPILLYVLGVIGLLGAILCQQRIAMVCSVFLVFVFAWWGKKNHNSTIGRIAIAIVLVGIFAIGYGFVDDRFSMIMEMLTGRLEEMSFSSAMSERTGQYERAYEEIFSYLITGKGLGAGGHSATMAGSVGIHDGEYFHLLLEFGLIGVFIFVPFIFKTVFRAIRNFNVFTIEASIVIYILLSGIGENVLSQSYLIGSIFWFCVGRIWNDNYYKRLNSQI